MANPQLFNKKVYCDLCKNILIIYLQIILSFKEKEFILANIGKKINHTQFILNAHT